MKLLLLRVLLQRRARDEGFTLPMVIALGLVMLLLGAVSITTANEEKLTAISQNSRSDALAIAEVGIARYRELLDRNRLLAINDSDQWGTITQICLNNIDEATDVNGNPYSDDDDVPSFLPNVVNPISLQEDGQVLNNDGDSTDVFNPGSYSLVAYNYINDNDTDADPLTVGIANGTFDLTDDTTNNNARGILTVRGTAPNNTGEAQIQVEIPIRINLGEMDNLAPALWIGDNTVSAADLGTLSISNGNVVIKDSAVITGTTRDGCRDFSDNDTTDGSQDLATGITGSVVSDSRDLPSIQQVIDDVTAARTALSATSGSPINTPLVDTPSTDQWLFGATTHLAYNPDPTATPTDCSNIKLCRYYYDFPGTSGLTYTDKDLLTDGVARTTLLLNQSLTINATSRNVKIGSTSDIVNDSNAFEIYIRDDDNDPTNGSANNVTIDTSGGIVTINGFIHAPQSTMTITGGGIVNINGAVWVGDFINSNGTTVNISPDLISRQPTPSDPSTSGRAYKFYSTTLERTARPLTGSPTNWRTEEIN